MNKNCLSHWFPLIESAGLPVPRTWIVRTPPGLELKNLLDGPSVSNTGEELIAEFMRHLLIGATAIGFPCFLRTGQLSGKHEWDRTCYLPDADSIGPHIWAIVEYSAMASLLDDLAVDVWAVRELLPTTPVFRVYRNMPVAREVRCFVRDGKVVCVHPYWPADALRKGFPHKRGLIEAEVLGLDPDAREIPADFDAQYKQLCNWDASVIELAECAGQAVGGGDWSVDILDTAKGWFVIDLAEAKKSFHWKECPHANLFKEEWK